MKSKCRDCPITKEYIEIGVCPDCTIGHLLMQRESSPAKCNICKAAFALPKARERVCTKDIRTKRYAISFFASPNKTQLFKLSKLLGFTVSKTYHLFQQDLPIQIDNIPMIKAYRINKYLQSANIASTISSSLEEYHLFEECWDI